MNRRPLFVPTLLALVFVAGSSVALAQDKGSVDPKPLLPLTNPNDPKLGAKELFGRKILPAAMPTQVIGFYSKGCIAGAQPLPINGPTWQVMRLSRNRNWGSPRLIAFVEKFAKRVRKVSNWPGILVGDMSQPRGGPMLTGHASHQIGLDVDVWLTPMPRHELSPEEREDMSAKMVVRPDRLDVDPNVWTHDDVEVIKAAADQPEVQRIFVNAAIKKALCREAGPDRAWLNKVRPYWGHDYHFHVRLYCPRGQGECEGQEAVPPGDGCDQLGWWFQPGVLHPRPKPHAKPRPPLTMAALPTACRMVLKAK